MRPYLSYSIIPANISQKFSFKLLSSSFLLAPYKDEIMHPLFEIDNDPLFTYENQGTYYHYGSRDKPFHLDYCFVSQDILEGIQQFYIGNGKEYLSYSDYVPLVVEFTLKSFTNKPIKTGSNTTKSIIEKSKFEKTIITPEILQQEYFLQIDREIATV
ncbi:hypothetical protein B1NLA3E_13955 [Bacillus sp. 1NLA3E]|nr:hypothetical protein B1NLA3E_13955 [Bacillus sp. 1NLA3E]